MGAFWQFLRRLPREIWFRTTAFTIGAVILALAAGFIGAALPWRVVVDLGQGSLDSLLQILASSMLAVTTFSITAMVTAFSSATTNATPRATQLFVEDKTSQNALSTFLGGFVFSLVGIIALSTGYYGDEGRTILFAGTLVVIGFIVAALLRWIAYLVRFGRMGDVIDRVENAATATMRRAAEQPAMGAVPVTSAESVEGTRVFPAQTGYVTHIDLPALERLAVDAGAPLIVLGVPGGRVGPRHPLAALPPGNWPDDAGDTIRQAVRIAPHRDYENDPRLGVIALSEIASRALSAAVNDPGTAIEVVAALERVFVGFLQTAPDDDVPQYPHVRMPAVRLDDLVVDAFRPLARDATEHVEVQVRLQKTLATLASVARADARPFQQAADDAWRRSRARLTREERADVERARRGTRSRGAMGYH